MPKIATLNSVYPTDCATLLAIRRQYADRVYFLNRGYINYYLGENNKPYEHRLVADLAFGYIPDRHHVHHINGIVHDNRLSNLELLSPSGHSHYHHGVAAIHAATCAACGAAIQITDRRLTIHKTHYCNRTCYRAAVTSEPDANTLQNLLNTIRNFSEIGRMYNASHATVRKWAIRRNLDISGCDGRKKRKYPVRDSNPRSSP